MQRPDAEKLHNPDPQQLRQLLADAGLTVAAAARQVGVCQRTLERYLSPRALERGHWCPYPLQYTLEALCWHRTRQQTPPAPTHGH